MASYLIPGKDGAFMLVETGPYSLLSQLEATIEELGFELDRLTDVLVTHIHLDHAGSAGALARVIKVDVRDQHVSEITRARPVRSPGATTPTSGCTRAVPRS